MFYGIILLLQESIAKMREDYEEEVYLPSSETEMNDNDDGEGKETSCERTVISLLVVLMHVFCVKHVK